MCHSSPAPAGLTAPCSSPRARSPPSTPSLFPRQTPVTALAVVAAFAVYYPDARLFIFPIPFPVRARKAVIFFIILSVAFMFVPALSFIGHSAHIGGLVAGYFLARAWLREMPEPPVLVRPVRKGMDEMVATLAVAELGETEFRRELRALLDELGHGRWRPLTLRERALLRRAHLLV